MRDRHPALYATDSLIAMKQRHYPLVTAIADEPGEHSPDIEVINSAERLRSTWGKYVADTRGLASFPTEALLRLAEALEANPKAQRAVTTSSLPLELARRWNLHDETAEPSETVKVNDSTPGSGISLPARVERPLWAPPPEVLGSDLPLQRMPPEESGHLPDASSW